MEAAHEVGEIAEADVVGDIGDRAPVLSQQMRRVPEPRAQQILVRGDAEHAREQPEKMERADIRTRGGVFQIDVVMRMGIDPERDFNGAPPIPRLCWRRLARPPGHGLDKPAGEENADLIETDIAAAVSGGLRQLGHHHQFGQRRHRADLPDLDVTADGLNQLGAEEE